MSRLLAFMCNDPERLACALHPARDALVAKNAPDGWGLAFFQGGEVLLQRHPKPATPLDFYRATREVRSDYLIGQVREPGIPSKLENTQPYRFRSWVFAQSGRLPSGSDEILQHVPDFLRRNVRGQSDAEHMFHVFLSFLHDSGKLDDANLKVADVASALRGMIALADRFVTSVGQPLKVNVAVTNGRVMLALRSGLPMWARQTNGITDCKVCFEKYPEEARGDRRKTTHDHLRAVLICSEPDKTGPEGWEEVPDSSVVGISRDLVKSILPLRGAATHDA